jgi:hypothetical protein
VIVKLAIEINPVTGEEVEGDELEVEFPSIMEQCPDCQGRGTTYLGWAAKDQPAFSEEEMGYDPDFADDYARGNFDKTCPICKGARELEQVDWELMDENDPLVLAYKEQLEEEASYQAECDAERRMGA